MSSRPEQRDLGQPSVALAISCFAQNCSHANKVYAVNFKECEAFPGSFTPLRSVHDDNTEEGRPAGRPYEAVIIMGWWFYDRPKKLMISTMRDIDVRAHGRAPLRDGYDDQPGVYDRCYDQRMPS